MDDNSTLGLLFEIAADPSKAVEGLSGLDSAATASAAKIQQAMENAKLAMDQGLGEAMARTQLVSAGLSEEAAKLAVQQIQAAEASQQLASALPAVSEAADRAEYSITNARMSMMELESMAGIRAPRAINTFISHLDGVGPALSVAFGGIAVLGIIDLIETQLPAAIDKAEGALTGWNKEAQKAFDEQIKINEEYVKTADTIEERLIRLQQKAKGISNAQAEQELIDLKDKDRQAEARTVETIKQAIQYKKEYIDLLRVAGESGGTIPIPKPPDTRSIEELNKELEKAQKNFVTLDTEIKKMQGAGIPEAEYKDFEQYTKKLAEQQKKAAEATKRLLEENKRLADEFDRAVSVGLEKETEERKRKLEELDRINLEIIRSDTEKWKTLESLSREYYRSVDEEDKSNERLLTESTKERVRQILAASKLQIQEEMKDADTHLKYWQAKDKELLASHQINQRQFIQNERTALQQWYNAQSEILQKQLQAAKVAYGEQSSEYQQMIEKMEQLDQQYATKSTQINTQEAKQKQSLAQIGLQMFDMLGEAGRKHHALEVAQIIERAAMKTIEYTAEALAAFATPGMQWSGALYMAAAAESAILGGFQAASGGGGGGGGGGYGGSGGGRGDSGGRGVGFSSLPMAAGAGVPGGTLHVVVMGESDGANYLAGMLTNNVRNGGTQLVASSSLG